MDRISVREKSGLELLRKLGIEGQTVLDPVFLLAAEQWKAMIDCEEPTGDIFVYDFDKSPFVESVCKALKEKRGQRICSFFPAKYADKSLRFPGPIRFLEALYHAEVIVSNSFHATVFALIWHKEFYVIKRQENINTRMRDLLALVGLEDRMIRRQEDLETAATIDWEQVDSILERERERSINFLRELTNG